ncbi:SPOSA6832_00253, partial [Sporobolomyces salmonicolor]
MHRLRLQPSASARALHTTAALPRHASKHRRPPPHAVLAPSTSRFGKPSYRPASAPSHARSSSPRPSPSSISGPALLAKLQRHLDGIWSSRHPSPPIRTLATDLGLSEQDLLPLAQQFAAAALRTLPTPERVAKGKAVATHQQGGAAPERAIEWDLEALRTAYITEGTEALWNASLATFLAFVRRAAPLPVPSSSTLIPNPTLFKLHRIADIADLRFAYETFPYARQQRRKLILHVGPTNSGKTFSALVALGRARTGPLRLLAHEVFSRFNEGKIGNEGKRTCNLITGEEQRILDPDAGLISCTVEMFPMTKRLDVGVIDEIQMIGDPQRGTAWTQAVVGSLCRELHLCGEESVVDLVQKIAAEVGDECIIKRYQRLSPLVVADTSLEGDLSRIRRGDCLVTFSRSNIFAFKRAIEQSTGLRVAVAYGGLPPEVREEQARAFNEGEYDVLVASDAVGMGLNLKIRRIVFESLHKWDGQAEVRLATPQIKQIAGRAGRYGVHTPVSPSAPDLDLDPAEASSPTSTGESVLGEATTLDAVDLPILRSAMAEPIVQVTQASQNPPFESFRALYELVSPSTPLSRIFALSRAITRTKPHYRSIGSASFGAVGDRINHIHPLTFEERYLFGSAPVNLRDVKVVEALLDFVQSYADGRPILMEDWGARVGLHDALERVSEVRQLKAAAAHTADRSTTPAPPPELTRRQSAVFSPTNLQTLESLHRCLTLYLWLSYRLSPIFCDQPAARTLRQQVERAIEFTLDGMRFERVDRGKGAKRNKAKFGGGEGGAVFDQWGRFKAGGAEKYAA